MSRCIVTGNLGFIGSHLADQLIADGHEVYGLDNFSTGRPENLNPEVHFMYCDVSDRLAVERIMAAVKPEKVFHLAALARIQPSIQDPVTWNQHNTDATLNLLWASHQNGVKKFVYSGSSSVYGDNQPPFVETQTPLPKNPYAVAKLMGEQWCKLFSELYNLDTTVLRYFNVYGNRQVLEGDYATVIGIFKQQTATDQNLTIVGDGTQKRDFTYVDDVVRANILASNTPGFGIYNIGTGQNIEIKEVAKLIQPDETKHTYGIIRAAEAKETLADNEKAKQDLGWEPTYTLEQGIAELK